MMAKPNPKANGKFYRGSNGPPHVLELLWSKHVEREEAVAAKAAEDSLNGVSIQCKAFGPAGTISKIQRQTLKSPKAQPVSRQEKRTAKLQGAVLDVLRKECFNDIRQDIEELKHLRQESDECVNALAVSIPRLTSTLRPLA